MDNVLQMGMLLLAEAPAAGPGGISPLVMQILTLWLPIGLLFYFLMIRPQRREQAKRRAMLDAMKKNDHIVTAGGIIGIIVNVNTSANEVTIRVDESNNTKLRMTRSSISHVLRDESSNV